MATVTVIVGFVKRLCDLGNLAGFPSAEAKALYELKRAPPPGFEGLVAIIRKIAGINAVYVEVEESLLSRFLLACENWDSVDYCSENCSLHPVSYSTVVPSAYKLGRELRVLVAQEHSVAPQEAHPYGLGIRVGLLDSGVSPHPYLPALSAQELEHRLSVIHPSIPRSARQSLCQALAACESAAGVDGIGLDKIVGHAPAATPNSPPIPIYQRSDLGPRVDAELSAFASEQWSRWKQEINDWLANRRRAARPIIPVHRHLAGAIRIFSPHSRSFVKSAEASGIMDVDGHGTRMAGIMAALRPCISQADPFSQTVGRQDHPLMEPAIGLCPYAEFMVLKCFNTAAFPGESQLNGALFDMVSALEYALELRPHILYVGLAAIDAKSNATQPVNDLLYELRHLGTRIIAPAGNEARTQSGLAFPAAARSVKAVTSVSRDPVTSAARRCDYSQSAYQPAKQRVAFCAFGGTKALPVVSTNVGSGFIGTVGTSVAAALAASIYTACASSLYVKKLKDEYDTLVGVNGVVDVDFVHQHIAQWVEAAVDLDNLEKAIDSGCAPISGSNTNNPSPEFGAGIIRRLDAMSIP